MFLVNRIENTVVREAVDWILHIGIAAIIALIITNFLFQRTVVNKTSMLPTLKNGDNLIVEKVSHRINLLKKGDIVTIFEPEYVKAEGNTIIKRIIGLEGDKIEVKDGKVFVNDKVLVENYINGNVTKDTGDYCNITVPKGQIYVLGDNRVANILDSRSMGTIPKERVTGKAVCRIYPFSHMTIF